MNTQLGPISGRAKVVIEIAGQPTLEVALDEVRSITVDNEVGEEWHDANAWPYFLKVAPTGFFTIAITGKRAQS